MAVKRQKEPALGIAVPPRFSLSKQRRCMFSLPPSSLAFFQKQQTFSTPALPLAWIISTLALLLLRTGCFYWATLGIEQSPVWGSLWGWLDRKFRFTELGRWCKLRLQNGEVALKVAKWVSGEGIWAVPGVCQPAKSTGSFYQPVVNCRSRWSAGARGWPG